MPQAFSAEWAAAWCAALNGSDAYRAAAATWEGAVVLSAGPGDAGAPAVYLDLWHGTCRAARAATPADRAGAAYVLEAEPGTWRALLADGASPVAALLSGRLRLSRGDLAALLPHAGAARELLRLADQVGTEFPPDW
jgi:putative sterol carrier protein